MAKKEKKKSIWKGLILKVIVESLLIGILLMLGQSIISHKIEPMTASEILKNENYLNAKKEVYFESIEIINRIFATSNWSEIELDSIEKYGYKRNSGTLYPTELESNLVYCKLCLYSGNVKIPMKFRDFFDQKKDKNTPLLCEFINLLKEDLGQGDWYIECDNEFFHTYTFEAK
jgi:hypothetical protein